MQKNRELLYQLIQIITGCLIVFYIIYLRAFTERPNRVLPTNLWQSADYGQLAIYSLILVFCAINLYFSTNVLFSREPKKIFPIFARIADWLLTCLNIFLNFVGNIIFGHGGAREIAENLGLFLKRYCSRKIHYYVLLLLFCFLPRILFLVFFSIDLFFYHQLRHIHVISCLLLLPMLILLVQKFLETFCITNFTELGEIFIVVDRISKQKFTPHAYFLHCIYTIVPVEDIVFEFVPNYEKEQNEKTKALNLYWNREKTMLKFVGWYENILIPIAIFLENFSMLKKTVFKFFHFSTSLFYLTLWIYILYCVW